MRKMIVAASRALVGKTLAHACEIAEANHSVIRVVERDGIAADVDFTLKSNRVNVSVEKDIVCRVLSIG